MVTLGADSHKATHTVVAVDETGSKLGHVTVKANSDGHLQALSWASQWSEGRWALEDCRHVSGRLERDLLGAGETVVRVPPRLTAGVRESARTRGKSDPIDALQILEESGLEQSAVEDILKGLKGARQEVLDLAASLPWGKEAALNPNAAGTRAILDARHFGADEVKQRVTELVTAHLESRRLGRGTGPGLRVLLVGPPGTGKSTIASSIAEALGVPFEQIRLGGASEAFSLAGAHPFYAQSGPGRLLEAVRKAGVCNPVVLLDELGGMMAAFNGDPHAAIMAAVDPALSRSYVDSFLGVPFNMGQVSWIATANEITSLSAALIDRFDIIELPGYSPSERLQIARELLLPKAIAANPIADGVTWRSRRTRLYSWRLSTSGDRGFAGSRAPSAGSCDEP